MQGPEALIQGIWENNIGKGLEFRGVYISLQT